MGPALFYPPGDAELPAAAAAVCATCPVVAPCLAEAMSTSPGEDFGVWAGTTPPERRRMRLPRSA
jgi:WhiB family transcriptional regulator, redox-sensing transcriptional regulator